MGELFRQGRMEEIWQRYCGFIDLSLQEFMEIQRELLMEQIDLLSGSELGKSLMRGKVPKSVEEFRRTVPLTTYEDYRPILARKREEGLPQRTLHWMRTSGRSGEYPHKWVPVSEGMDRAWGISPLASVIFSACTRRGDIPLQEGDRFLYTLAPPPYASGHWSIGLQREFPFRFLPPLHAAEAMSFQDRIEQGFQLALREGIDLFWGLSSVLVAVGESFSRQARRADLSRLPRHPRSFLRLNRGLLASRLGKRPLLPKDLWRPKGIVALGMDTSVLRNRVIHYWGRQPLEIYGATELGFVATQAWDYDGMTFAPDINFLEFIPEEEHLRSRADSKHRQDDDRVIS
ncbi:MAG: GH3 auxin-responsive promoter family protein [Anaerolineae bacterium]